MSSKENAAVSQLLGLLESRYAMRVLWALKDGHAQTFRLLQDSVGGITPNTLNTRLLPANGPTTRPRRRTDSGAGAAPPRKKGQV